MNNFLQKLFNNDCKINDYSDDLEIIKQGLAPILAIKNNSISLQKANLLEQSKYLNWQEKAKILFNELDKNHIQFLVFKGFAYSFLIYEKSHIRPYSDIDIFVQEKDCPKVEQILHKLNYIKMASRQGKFVSFQNSFYDNQNTQTTIDLHWQINNRIEIHEHFQFQSLYQSSNDVISPPFIFKSLNQIDAFILACFHFQAHRPKDRKHIWLYDLALLWNSMNEKNQFKCLDYAKEKKQLQLVSSTLHQLKNTFIDCIVVDLKLYPINNNSHVYLHNREKKITDIKNRLKNIKGLFNKIKYLSEYVFQSKTYVRNRFQLNSTSWVYLYYPRMWYEDIVKLFKN